MARGIGLRLALAIGLRRDDGGRDVATSNAVLCEIRSINGGWGIPAALWPQYGQAAAEDG